MLDLVMELELQPAVASSAAQTAISFFAAVIWGRSVARAKGLVKVDSDAPIISGRDGGLGAQGDFHGLHVIGANYGETRCPYHLRWVAEAGERKTKGVDEKKAARRHAQFFVPTTRTWSNSTFESGLDASSRSEAERVAITQDMYQLYEDEVAANPQDHAMDYQHVYLSIEKR